MTKEEFNELKKAIAEVTMDYCTCGGDGPETGCEACKIYHELSEFVDGMTVDDAGEVKP